MEKALKILFHENTFKEMSITYFLENRKKSMKSWLETVHILSYRKLLKKSKYAKLIIGFSSTFLIKKILLSI